MTEINNEVAEDYCSFEVSKLLKEKGFRRFEESWFTEKGDEIHWADVANTHEEKDLIAKPTLALAIKWIFINFGLMITIRAGIGSPLIFDYLITSKGRAVFEVEDNFFDLVEEATQAAILYTLKRLIA